MSLAALGVLLLGSFQADMDALVRKLRSERVEERDEAAAVLRALGEKAVPALERLAADRDPEVAARARELVRELTQVRRLVLKSLLWLAENQRADGAWKAGHDDYDPAVTGLGVLAFLAAGIAPDSQEREAGVRLGEPVRKGLGHLLAQQRPEGVLVSREAAKYLLTHAIATVTLCEAARLKPDPYRGAAEKAAGFLLAAQNPCRAWRYSLRGGDNDTHVTLWAVLALKAAEAAGLDVPPSAFEGATAWFEEVSDEDGRAGYTHRGVGRIVLSRGPYDHPEARTAMGLLGWCLLDSSKANPKAAARLAAAPPRWARDEIDLYYWFLGSLALARHEGETGARFKAWNQGLKAVLLAHPEPDKSWAWLEPNLGEGGTAYVMALRALALQIPTDRVSVLRGSSR